MSRLAMYVASAPNVHDLSCGRHVRCSSARAPTFVGYLQFALNVSDNQGFETGMW